MGHMSPQEAQKFAAAAEADIQACQEYVHGDAVFSFVGLRELAGLGHGGYFSQHAWSGFLSLIRGVNIPWPFGRDLPIVYNSQLTSCLQFFILPHQLFANLYHHYRAEFARRMLGAEGTMENFWNAMSDHPALDGHLMKETRNWKNLYVPIALHGDGVPISGVGKSWQRSSEIWSWNSLLAWGPTMKMMNFIFALFKDVVSERPGHHTRDAFMRVLVWSLGALFEGEHPAYCPNGHYYDEDSPEGRLARQPLCGRGNEKYRGVLLANCGDLEHHW